MNLGVCVCVHVYIYTKNIGHSFKVSSIVNSKCSFHGALDKRKCEWDLSSFNLQSFILVSLS